MSSLDEEEVDGVRVLRLSGSLTQGGIDTLEPAFRAALPDGARAVVDLAGVDLISTPGLALIISASKRLRGTEGRLVFTSARGPVSEMFRRCRLDEVLELARDRDEALAKARG